MASGRFVAGAALRACAAAALAALALSLALAGRFPISAAVAGACSLAAFAALVRYVTVTNRRLAALLLALRHADYGELPSLGRLGGSFAELEGAIAALLERFRGFTTELESSNRYLAAVVQHVDVGVIVYDEAGSIDTMNRSARRILGAGPVRRIQEIPVSGFVEAALSSPLVGRRLLAWSRDGRERVVALRAAAFRLRDRALRIASVQDIRREIEETELGSWLRMMRVLNHEIMNSVTPIVSLASSAARLLDSPLKPEQASLDDVALSVRTIERRGQALLKFAESYRRLYTVPVPELAEVAAEPLLARLRALFATKLAAQSATLRGTVDPPGLTLRADQVLLEQVLINLVENALQAGATAVEVVATLDQHGRPLVRVADNGSGIAPEVLESIFVPFFTTKPAGSGIGLSLSRHIMLLHHGSIDAESSPGEGSAFTLRFGRP